MSAHRSLVNDGTIAAGDALAFGSRTSAAEPGTGLGAVNDEKAAVAIVAAAVKEGLPSEVDPYPGIS